MASQLGLMPATTKWRTKWVAIKKWKKLFGTWQNAQRIRLFPSLFFQKLLLIHLAAMSNEKRVLQGLLILAVVEGAFITWHRWPSEHFASDGISLVVIASLLLIIISLVSRKKSWTLLCLSPDTTAADYINAHSRRSHTKRATGLLPAYSAGPRSWRTISS